MMRSRNILTCRRRQAPKWLWVTATDKLCKQFGNDLDFSKCHVCFSSQIADKCTMEKNGIEDGLDFPRPAAV